VINNGDSVFVKSNTNLADFHHTYIDDYVTVYGAPYHASLRNMIASWFFYDRTIINLKKRAQKTVDSVGFDGPRLNGIFEALDVVNKSFVMEVFTPNPNQTDSEIVFAYPMFAYPVYQRSGHAAFLADAYNELNPEMKKSFVGKEMKELTRLCVGQPFPDFKLPTPEGGELALNEVVAKSKITIVHFWAANSSNRRKMEDELRLMYKKYHDKGLNVIGFCSDKYADEWRDNVKTEQFPWYNVSDLKGKDGMVENVYHEFGNSRIHNTTNVLIDLHGKILAWDVEGAELQWYLWKYCGE
jgi:peroxiredoxin